MSVPWWRDQVGFYTSTGGGDFPRKGSLGLGGGTPPAKALLGVMDEEARFYNVLDFPFKSSLRMVPLSQLGGCGQQRSVSGHFEPITM